MANRSLASRRGGSRWHDRLGTLASVWDPRLEGAHEPGLLSLRWTGRSFDDQFILLLDCLNREKPEPRTPSSSKCVTSETSIRMVATRSSTKCSSGTPLRLDSGADDECVRRCQGRIGPARRPELLAVGISGYRPALARYKAQPLARLRAAVDDRPLAADAAAGCAAVLRPNRGYLAFEVLRGYVRCSWTLPLSPLITTEARFCFRAFLAASRMAFAFVFVLEITLPPRFLTFHPLEGRFDTV